MQIRPMSEIMSSEPLPERKPEPEEKAGSETPKVEAKESDAEKPPEAKEEGPTPEELAAKESKEAEEAIKAADFDNDDDEHAIPRKAWIAKRNADNSKRQKESDKLDAAEKSNSELKAQIQALTQAVRQPQAQPAIPSEPVKSAHDEFWDKPEDAAGKAIQRHVDNQFGIKIGQTIGAAKEKYGDFDEFADLYYNAAEQAQVNGNPQYMQILKSVENPSEYAYAQGKQMRTSAAVQEPGYVARIEKEAMAKARVELKAETLKEKSLEAADGAITSAAGAGGSAVAKTQPFVATSMEAILG